MKLYIDGDGCNARARSVALRLSKRGVCVVLVSNLSIDIANDAVDPAHYHAVVVERAEGAVDAYVLKHISKGDALITRDLHFAKQALEKGAWVVSDYGERYDITNIDARIISAQTRMDMRKLASETRHEAPRVLKTKKTRQLHIRLEQLAQFFDAWLRHYQ